MSLDVDIRHSQGDFTLAARFQCGAGVTALFGRSGAGKTTLVNLIAGLIRPREGRIAVDGRVLVDTRAKIFLPPHKRRIGYVFQDARLLPHLDVRRNLLYGRWLADGMINPRRDGFEHTVALLGLEQLLARRPGTLSGGEKQRVAIGRALLARPALLLLDEPLASLDTARKEEILPYLERLRDELRIPIVHVSHALPEVTRLATNVVLLSAGRVEAVGSVAELAARLDLYPLTGRYEAGAVLACRVAAHDAPHGLTQLLSPAGPLWVPQLDLALDASVNIRIRARDVTLFLDKPQGSSALNIFSGQVSEIVRRDGAAVDVKLDCSLAPDQGSADVIARITRLSAERLNLTPGQRLYAAIKTVAMDRRGITGLGPPAI
ncbi:molybdenum ABC transporter ATP-binding protein [Ferrovibrio sp.]|uniref:molybdenum ABC transporter ATP-binding protein n=1 Tax=Ferrovibrio sp. TaxID=1917215 RepID=UPI003D11BB7C